MPDRGPDAGRGWLPRCFYSLQPHLSRSDPARLGESRLGKGTVPQRQAAWKTRGWPEPRIYRFLNRGGHVLRRLSGLPELGRAQEYGPLRNSASDPYAWCRRGLMIPLVILPRLGPISLSPHSPSHPYPHRHLQFLHQSLTAGKGIHT